MILMNGQSLTPKAPLYPETQSMQLGERDSQSTFTIGPDAPEITVGDWIMEDAGPGLGVTWRVRSVDTDYHSGSRTVHLEHVLQTLKDGVIFGEVSAADMGGGDTVSAYQAIQYVLARQSIWQLGNFGYNLAAPFEFNGNTLLDALEDVCTALPDCVWTYDTTRLPFTLNIMPQSATVSCEMRGGRNLSTIQKSIDRSRMYTRIYPVGADDLHIAGEYLESNTALYGVISKVETDQAYDTDAKLRQWAQDRLRRHCEPTVTITINGMELSAETGEPLDKLTVGTVCRVPIPELGVVMAEKITRLNYKDVIRDPVDVTVTLANNLEDVATIFKKEKATTDKASRSSARGGKKLDNKIEDTAEGLISVLQRTAGEIYMKVENTREDLQSSIDILDHSISLVVEGTGDNAHIKPAAITAAITDENGYLSSSIHIGADSVKIDGRTSIADVLTVAERGAVRIKGSLLVDNGVTTTKLTLRSGGSALSIDETILGSMIRSATHNTTTNTLTLTKFNGQVINFKKATALSGRWSGSGQGTVADFECAADDTSIPVLSTYITLSSNGTTVYAKDPSGITRASLDTGGSGYTYTLFGRFDRYGTVSVEGQTYMAYITQDTSASASNLALYRRN